MISAIVWSKDRPCQLHLLLESIQKHIPNTFYISVIYKSSTSDFQKGYNLLLNRFTDVHFYMETENYDLEYYTKVLLHNSLEKTSLFTDDTVIYRQSPLSGEALFKKLELDNAVFSLRLGNNTLLQDYQKQWFQPPLNLYIDEDKTISWNFNLYNPMLNYGYPFGLDGHIYPTSILYSFIKEIDFKNTHELESKLLAYKNRIPQALRSFKTNICVNMSINSHFNKAPTGETYQYSTQILNEKYLEGQIINLEEIEKQDIIGCHQELPLLFKEYNE